MAIIFVIPKTHLQDYIKEEYVESDTGGYYIYYIEGKNLKNVLKWCDIYTVWFEGNDIAIKSFTDINQEERFRDFLQKIIDDNKEFYLHHDFVEFGEYYIFRIFP